MTSVVIHCCKSGTNPIIFFSHLNLVTIYQRSVYNTESITNMVNEFVESF